MVRASTSRFAWLFCAVLPLVAGCADKTNHSTPVAGGGASNHQPPNADICNTPQEGCPCENDGEVVECGSVARHSDGYTSCSMGERICEAGEWGACEGDKIVKIPDPDPAQQGAQALGNSAPCIDNPCDPFCQVVVDDSSNLGVGGGLTATDNGLTLTAVPPDPAANTCTDIKLDPPTQTVTVTDIKQITGLKGEYFNQRNNSVTSIPAAWVVTATRTDPTVDFNWGNAAPGPAGIGIDNFSVRWTGYIFPPATGSYTISVRSDDGARLWLDGTLAVNKWVDQGPTQYAAAPVTLTQGVPYPIRMEYFENSGGAVAQLKWSSAAIPEQVIPEAYLSPTIVPESPYVLSPVNPTLTVSVVPPTCYDGVFTAAWGLDTLDRATINNGVLTMHSPIAGPIQVSAYVQEFSDTATVNVVVNVINTVDAPAGSAAIFAGASSGADVATILYPYDATVFPLSLKPPVLQWDTGGQTATAVKVTLSSPAVGAPTFSISKIMTPPTNQRYAFTREQWGAFERTAKAGTGKISLQRIVGGQLKDAISKTVTFASTPLRGKIFYTQYGGGSKIMRLDPGGDIIAVDAFNNGDTGCPVCHSMSANGSKFATANYAYSTINGGISSVDSAGNLTRLSDFQNPGAPYSNGKDDWRGFAWAPFTPDGNFIFATNNIYGNTKETLVGIDSATRTVLLPAAMVSGGLGTGLQADYYATADFTGPSWQRIDPRPEFDWLADASPSSATTVTPWVPPVPYDNFSAVWSGEVEGFFTEAHTFEVESNAGVRLTVGGTVIVDNLANATLGLMTGTANLIRGQKTAIRLEMVDKNPQTIIKLRWQSAQTPKTLIPQSQLFPTGGQRGAVAVYNDGVHAAQTRLESDMSADWGTSSPVVNDNADATRNINVDTFTSVWQGLVEAPVTTNLQWCIRSDDGVKVYIDGNAVPIISGAGSTNSCATAMAVTAGQKYLVRIEHTEGTGNAYAQLSWQMATFITTRELVPSARIYPPATFVAPTSGLRASIYDTMDFGYTMPTNPATPQAYNTYIPNVDYDWAGGRFSRGKGLTSSDTWAIRAQGQLQPACTGIHEFEIVSDDNTNVWIGSERLVRITSAGTKYAARWLDAALWYDFKLDWQDNGGNAAAKIRWKPACNGALTYTAVPQANFRPTGDTTLNGYLRQGGDNGNGSNYVAWQTPNAVGAPSVDVSTASPGTWGLGASVMMLPTFAPDASKMVFVDGDSATNAGWRKGLSTFDFDQTNKIFKNRRQIVNNFPYGDVIKWPTYESDSKSVLYQTSNPGEFCCRGGWTKYGYMAPTNYFEDPGKIWSVDTTAASPTPVALDKLNNGERAIDRNKAYQITTLPTATGGYRWAVFTSTRPYGNTVNLPAVQQDYSNPTTFTSMTNTAQLQSMLWVSAMDDSVSAGTDRSHPAFFLPNQNYSETGGHYLNERAYWVTEACRAAGSGAASTCDVDEDCCGGTVTPKTGVCRIDTPITQPPTRHCASVPPPNACIAANGACSASSDCCFNYPCVSNICVKPPPLPTYHPDNFQRLYTAECGTGTLPVWRFFDWQAVTPPIGSAIEIYAESSDDASTLQTLPLAPNPVGLSGVVLLATVTGATVPGWVGQDVGAKLKAAGVPQRKYLMITLRFLPNTKITATPVVTDWRQSYSCPPQE